MPVTRHAPSSRASEMLSVCCVPLAQVERNLTSRYRSGREIFVVGKVTGQHRSKRLADLLGDFGPHCKGVEPVAA
jgi:hypothetical protein